MKDTIFLVRGERELVELTSEPYDSEDLLQALLKDFPTLLAGAGAGRSLLLVQREAGIPGDFDGGARWSLDHLFVDDQAVPTLVEVKRSSDTRCKRIRPDIV